MPLRLLAALSGRRSPRPASSQARRRRLAVESLEGRELMAVDFTSGLGVGSNSMSTGAVAVDTAGNTVVTGYFTGTADFDPGAGVTNLTAVGTKDIYLAEYSKAGTLLWAKSLPSAAGTSAQANGIAIDAAGNIGITGSLNGSANFNPGGSGGTLTSTAGLTDAFVAKFTSTGGFTWASRFGGSGADQGGALGFDSSGNLLVTGTYTGATTFGATTLTGTNASAFVTKIGATGAVQWAQGFSGSSLDYGTRIAVDAAGNAYAGGIYQGTITIGAATLSVAPGVSSAYVAKLSPAGAVGWAVGFGGTANTTAGGLAVDGAGNVLAAGNFKGTSNFGGASLTSAGAYYNGYVVKLNANGAGVWSRQFSGTNNVFITGVGTDSLGAAYLGGQFQGTADLDPSAGTVNLTSQGGQDVFASKLDGSGNLAWALQAGGAGNDATGAIAMVGTDAVAMVGNYAGPAVFGGSLLQSLGSTNMSVVQVSPPVAQAVAGPADFLTAQSVGGNILDGRAVALDAAGNSYVTGTFNGTVDFDPGAGVSNLTAVGYKDIYVAAYSPSGALLWAKGLPGTGVNQSQGNGIAVDAAGNILVAGSFAGAVNFNPGGSGGSLTSAGGTDAFLVKLSPTGGFAWARRYGSTGTDQGLGVAVDGSGNAVVAGNYSGSAAFGGITLANVGSNDGFISKVDPSGNTLWATRFGGLGSDSVADLAADAAGNVYATGFYSGASVAYTTSAGLSLSLLGNASLPSAFAMKLNASGGIAWVDGFTGAGNTSAGGVAVDASGNVFVSGTIRAATNFGGISVSPYGSATSSAFLAKINPGGSVAWAQRVGGASPALGVDVQTDSLGNVYLGGEFTGSTNFATGTGTATLGGYGSLDIFIAKYDTNGAYVWARQAGGSGNDYVRSLAVKGPDDVTVVGMYMSTASFNNTLLNDKVNSSTMYVSRIAKKS